jgi:thiol-disulfide isomerase/thioredoxin
MKTLMMMIALFGTAKYCSRPRVTTMPFTQLHQDKLKGTLKPDLESQDTLAHTIASRFLQSIPADYNDYHPDSAALAGLKAIWSDSIEIRVIGGNWCSDTRRQLPRLCKVLDALGANAEHFGYYLINKDKKALNNDFAAAHEVKRVPTAFIFKNGKRLGEIVETPKKSWESHLLEILKSGY